MANQVTNSRLSLPPALNNGATRIRGGGELSGRGESYTTHSPPPTVQTRNAPLISRDTMFITTADPLVSHASGSGPKPEANIASIHQEASSSRTYLLSLQPINIQDLSEIPLGRAGPINSSVPTQETRPSRPSTARSLIPRLALRTPLVSNPLTTYLLTQQAGSTSPVRPRPPDRKLRPSHLPSPPTMNLPNQRQQPGSMVDARQRSVLSTKSGKHAHLSSHVDTGHFKGRRREQGAGSSTGVGATSERISEGAGSSIENKAGGIRDEAATPKGSFSIMATLSPINQAGSEEAPNSKGASPVDPRVIGDGERGSLNEWDRVDQSVDAARRKDNQQPPQDPTPRGSPYSNGSVQSCFESCSHVYSSTKVRCHKSF